jgi:sugar lactone lactonase YvrE
VDKHGALHVWEPATGKLICSIREPSVGEDQASFSPDGELICVKHRDHVIRVWDAGSGKLRCALPEFGQRRFPHPHAFAPDSRTLATASSSMDDSVIRLWDTTTGKQTGKLEWQDGTSSSCLAFSPDGEFLLSAHYALDPMFFTRKHYDTEDIDLRLWSLRTRRLVRRFPARIGDVRSLAISPDGKTMAAPTEGGIVLWELATGKERGRFEGHAARIWSLAFSADGRLLASGSLDYSGLVWDVTGICPDGKWAARDAQPGEIERLWAELADDDGVRAYRAVWQLAGVRQAVPFLAQHLRTVPNDVDPRTARLIADLDSDQFETRSRAFKELQRLGEAAEVGLLRAWAGKSSLEARRRLESLLVELESRSQLPDQLRWMRGLEALEHSGLPEARRLMEVLAKGAPEARLTIAAKGSLARLHR